MKWFAGIAKKPLNVPVPYRITGAKDGAVGNFTGEMGHRWESISFKPV